jgi:hypothetical protein
MRNSNMKRIFAAVFALACIVGYTPAFAANAHGVVHGSGGMNHSGAGSRLRVPNMQNRIPAPLAEPAQPPVINGPVGPSGLPPMGGAR